MCLYFHSLFDSYFRLANNNAQSELHGDAKGPCVEDARDSHRLAYPGSLTIPLATRDPVLVREHHRSLLVSASGITSQTSTGWHYMYVHRCESRGDRRTVGAELPLLRRFIVHRVRDSSGGAIRVEDARLEHELPQPHSLPATNE